MMGRSMSDTLADAINEAFAKGQRLTCEQCGKRTYMGNALCSRCKGTNTKRQHKVSVVGKRIVSEGTPAHIEARIEYYMKRAEKNLPLFEDLPDEFIADQGELPLQGAALDESDLAEDEERLQAECGL